MNNRVIIREFVNGQEKTLKELGLEGKEIINCWTIYDEDKMWESNTFNPFTGKSIEKGVDLEGLILQHEVGVLCEDRMDDWRVSGDIFKYYSRYVKLGNTTDILIEFI